MEESSAGEVSSVHWDHDPMRMVGMTEDLMAALGAVVFPAAAFEGAHGLLGRYRREPRRHAATVTRSISTGRGTGSPCATSDSM